MRHSDSEFWLSSNCFILAHRNRNTIQWKMDPFEPVFTTLMSTHQQKFIGLNFNFIRIPSDTIEKLYK